MTCNPQPDGAHIFYVLTDMVIHLELPYRLTHTRTTRLR